MKEEDMVKLISKAVKGGIDRFFRLPAWIIVILCIGSYAYNLTDFGKDSTDSPDGRSNMAVRTDHKTGCEYLESGGGGLTPRLSVGNKHLGCLLK